MTQRTEKEPADRYRSEFDVLDGSRGEKSADRSGFDVLDDGHGGGRSGGGPDSIPSGAGTDF